MNPAVGVTKILNNLQECIDIIEEINETNKNVLPSIDFINHFLNLKNQLLDVMQNEKFDHLQSLSKSCELTSDILKMEDKFYEMIDRYIKHHKELLKEFDLSLYNAKERIKNMSGENRITWFEGWKKNELESDLFKGIITAYSSWEYPVMEIFPGTGDMLPHALGAEPLYIADWDDLLIEKVSSQFNEYYANKRLMKYKIDQYDLSALPQTSFGFVYCINFINFEDLENLLVLAKNVFNCLMPGGTYVFTYNNSNDWWSVKHAVETFMGLVDSEELKQGLEQIGYSVEQICRPDELRLSYVICKKPGEIEYIKNSSVLGKIIDKPNELM